MAKEDGELIGSASLAGVSGGAVAELRSVFEDYAQEPQMVEVSHPGSKVKGHALILPKSLSAVSAKAFIDEYRLRPERRKGTARVTSLDSLIGMANRSKDEHSVLFAIEEAASGGSSIAAVLNYNESGAENPSDESRARYGDHVVVFPCPASDEWKAWTGQDGKEMQQGAFAAFLEDRVMDLAPGDTFGDPESAEILRRLKAVVADPARVIEVAQGIEIHQSENIHEHTKLQSGETRFVWQTEHKNASGAPIDVPGFFAIAIPVFRFGDKVPVLVRLRYRVNNGRVVWYFQLYRPTETRRQAFLGLCAKVREATALALFYGTPENGLQ